MLLFAVIEPFKNLLSEEVALRIGRAVRQAHPGFDLTRFRRNLGRELESLELKQRMQAIADRLEAGLPREPGHLFEILIKSLSGPANPEGLESFSVWPLSEIVSRRGLGDFPAAMNALREMTIRFTGEFAIRKFLLEKQKETLRQMQKWTTNPNPHVRRLASEGSRPVLPWGEKLPRLLEDPTLTLPILDQLHTDDSEYVRRSVANHLNDFSRRHPAHVTATLARWKKENHPGFPALARRAARTLVKQGDPAALRIFGIRVDADLKVRDFSVRPLRVKIGGVLEFQFTVINCGKQPASVLFDYAIHHRKAAGHCTPKVFKGRTAELAPGAKWMVEGRHSFRIVTTRKYHPGEHRMEILLNGRSHGSLPFELV